MPDGFDLLHGVLLTRLLDPHGDDLHASLLAGLRGRRGAGRRAARVWRVAVLAGEGFDQAEIAVRVGVGVRTVRADLAVLRDVLDPDAGQLDVRRAAA